MLSVVLQDFFITPLVNTWVQISPGAQVCVTNSRINRAYWQQRMAAVEAQKEATAQSTAAAQAAVAAIARAQTEAMNADTEASSSSSTNATRAL
jgi:hypothetical protein